jgi:hypothetical protein
MHGLSGLDLSGKTSYVYFLRISENGPIKIGFTKRLRERLSKVQVDNPFFVKLIAVTKGGRKEEYQLHQKFAKYRLYGEWFDPAEELLRYIEQFEKLDIVSADFQKPTRKGDASHNWKGDAACIVSKRQRARAHTRHKKSCERCKLRKGLDTVYKDGNKDNLDPANLVLYCRRCRMELDGTLDNLKSLEREKRPRPCKICGKITTRFWYDRCGSCNEFWRRNGLERTEKQNRIKDPVPCNVCSNMVKHPAKGKCHSCYEFYRRNGFDKDKVPLKDLNTPDVNMLKSMGNMTHDKANLIRNLYISKQFSNKFLAQSASISISYFNDIIRNRYFKNDNYVYQSNRESSNRRGVD